MNRTWRSGAMVLLLGLYAQVVPLAQGGTSGRQETRIRFLDGTAASGLHFRHFNGWSGRRYLVETMGSGVCVFDYDGDAVPDIYLVQGAPTPGSDRPDPIPTNTLYRNDGRAHFVDVTRRAGVGDPGQGMGCTAGDVDGDGDLDLYVVNFGPNVLYRNNGDGTFADATKQSGTGDPRWGSSAAFADIDTDGDLDLYVANYVDFSYAHNKFCGDARRNLQYYCSPKAYEAAVDVMYRNDGQGHFTDATRESGVYNDREAKGLGAIFGDVDGDGDQDLYVANDSTRNFLYRNDGKGHFRDLTLLSGVGYSEAGVPQAGMGVDLGDSDNDLDLDLVVTNLSNESNDLYSNLGSGIFTDRSFSSGLGSPGLLYVGFGVVWLDADSDGDLDLFIANGHILDNVSQLSDAMTYAQPNHLFENLGGGRFKEVGAAAGPGLGRVEISRGLAEADFDGDGDQDLVISNNRQRAVLLLNESRPGGHWLKIRLVGRLPNRFAVGARVILKTVDTAQMREVRTGHSYQSQSDLILHFGLGSATTVKLILVRWPDGVKESSGPYAVDQMVTLREGKGLHRPAEVATAGAD